MEEQERRSNLKTLQCFSTMQALIDKIKNKKINIAVIGLGYVGLPLAVESCKSGFKVRGIDIDEQKIATIAEAARELPK